MVQLESKAVLATELSVFTEGKHKIKTLVVKTSFWRPSSSPPKPLLIYTPIEQGPYPVLLFFPGTALANTSYSQLLQHIASHGFIVIVPELYSGIPPSGNKEVQYAANVTNWLPSGLQTRLPEGVQADLKNIALAGHSRGGQAAFGLALGTYFQTSLKFSTLIGLDPVAGVRGNIMLDPPLLTNIAKSFDLSIPVAVIGTGLGDVGHCMGKACAPKGVSYGEFFRECKPPCARFVATKYGHMDMLDNRPPDMMSWFMSKNMCENGKEPRDPMRRCVGGIVVAFLKKVFEGESADFTTIVQKPDVAPIELMSVKFIEN